MKHRDETYDIRYVVQFDDNASKWLVFDQLNGGQAVGAHAWRGGAVIQAEDEERRWRRFGPGTETFALVAFQAASTPYERVTLG